MELKYRLKVVDVMYEEFFGKRLSQLRTQIGASARDMSLSIGQSESYISKIENGKSMPSMASFFFICDYLKVQPRDFFDDGIAVPAKVSELLKEAKGLNDKQLNIILELIRNLKHK